MRHKWLIVTLFVSQLLILPAITSAHPGRTDSSGGHTCRTNCASWGLGDGEYHFHGGGVSSGGSTGSTYTAPVADTQQTQIIVAIPATPSHSDQNSDPYFNKNANPDANDDTVAACNTFTDHYAEEKGKTCTGKHTSAEATGVF